jgi:predicted ATPase
MDATQIAQARARIASTGRGRFGSVGRRGSEDRPLDRKSPIQVTCEPHFLGALVGDSAALDQRAGELIAVAIEQGFPYWRALGTAYRGWVAVKIGDVAEGKSLLRIGSAAYRATGSEAWTPHIIALLAGACQIAGQIEEALILLDDASHIVERTGERWFAAELNRHKGRLLLRQGHADAAEDLYQMALNIAREQQAKLWELRAALSLAPLRRDQDRPVEARDLLAPVHAWFTEGFDTPDLKEAKALLDELSA